MRSYLLNLVTATTCVATLVAVPSANARMGMGGMMGGTEATPNSAPANSPGARMVQQYCSACHVPPEPGAHTPDEWPAVVQRMKRYMVQTGRPVPGTDAMTKLMEYLQGRDQGAH